MSDIRLLSLSTKVPQARAILFDEAGTAWPTNPLNFSSISQMAGSNMIQRLFATMSCDIGDGSEARSRGNLPIAIGITNQRETAIIWDRATGKAIHNAIVGRTGVRPISARL